MEERRLVARVRNTTDKRKVNIYLTEEGRRLRDVLMPYAREVNRLALAGLTASEIATFDLVLGAMRRNLRTALLADEPACDGG